MESRPHGHVADPSDADVPPDPSRATARQSSPPEDLNLKQVARSLGVHYMTAYRYVRKGLLPARRPGQIWLVDPADLDDFRRGRPATGRPPPADWSDRLGQRLQAGDEVGAWTIVTDALSAGRSPQACHLDLLTGPLAILDGEATPGPGALADRCVANTTAMRLVARLGATFRHRGRSRGTMVVGMPPGEHDGLATAIIANLVRLNGVAVRELGTDVPPAAFVHTCGALHDLVAMTIGVTCAERLPAVHEVVDAVRTLRPGLPVLVSTPAALKLDGFDPGDDPVTLCPDVAETVLAITRLVDRGPPPEVSPEHQ